MVCCVNDWVVSLELSDIVPYHFKIVLEQYETVDLGTNRGKHLHRGGMLVMASRGKESGTVCTRRPLCVPSRLSTSPELER